MIGASQDTQKGQRLFAGAASAAISWLANSLSVRVLAQRRQWLVSTVIQPLRSLAGRIWLSADL